MKVITYLLLIITSFSLGSCSDDDNSNSPIDIVRGQLLGTWEVSSVFLEGFDVTSPSYDDFLILFRPDGSYYALDADPVFTESGGFWRFLDNNPQRLEIGGVEGVLTFSEDAEMITLKFTAPGEPIGASGRGEGLEGEYEFRLLKSDQIIEE